MNLIIIFKIINRRGAEKRVQTMTRSWRILVSIIPILGGWPVAVAANERHFTYTYESAVLPPGAKEIEVWATGGFGRNEYYAQLDQRLEFEVGLTERLMTAV